MQVDHLSEFMASRTAVEVAEIQIAKQGAPDGDFAWPLDVVSLEASFPQELQLTKAAHFDGLGVVCCAQHACVSAAQPCLMAS